MSSENPAGNEPHPGSLTFPRVARLELDELLVQLVERAQEVMRTQNRMHGLLEANRAIASDLSLSDLLQRIVNVARDLVDARYAALGVLGGPGRDLAQFIHVGMEDSGCDMAELPHGRGILGLLIEEPEPLRLDDLTQHPKSVGFPEGHPPMRSFLGVPVTIRGQVFGNLYLTEKRGAEGFSREDEELVAALATSAASAIDNARLYDATVRRERWLEASRRITNALLGVVDRSEALQLVAAGAREAARAAVAAVLLPTPAGEFLRVEAAEGHRADELPGQLVPAEGSISGEAIRTGRAVVLDGTGRGPTLHLLGGALGPAMVVPLAAQDQILGALLVGNESDGALFDEEDLGLVAAFAGQATLVLTVAQAQQDARRMEMLEDRTRIARDLHDHVIQRLFATGLNVQALASEETGPRAEALLAHVDELDEIIRDIRTTIFSLRRSQPGHDTGLRARLIEATEEITSGADWRPRVQFEGPIDTAVPSDIAEDVLAVVRESLSNVSRHADAHTVEVLLSAHEELVLRVRDDGRGFTGTTRRSGLRNIEERAERHGGSCTVTSRPNDGTTVAWRVPLR